MKPKSLVALVVGALLAVSAAAVALPSQAADQAREHADDRSEASADASSTGDEASDDAAEDAGPSEHALFGLCTAYDNSADGRENGQAGDAGPFQWLADMAGGAIAPFCEDVDHPADRHGPPADVGR